MKKKYNIELDCAHCANLMEEAVNKLEGVSSCVFNFMAQKMIVEFNEGYSEKEVTSAIVKVCKKIEPDCEIEI